MGKSTQSSRRDVARMRVGAVTKYFSKKSITVDGDDLSAKDLAQVFQRQLDTEDAVDLAKAKYREAIAARSQAAAKATRVSNALQGIVNAAYGPGSTASSEFGFTARKVAEKSAETKALAVEKLRATRAARHTMGARQKASIHGAVGAPSDAATPPLVASLQPSVPATTPVVTPQPPSVIVPAPAAAPSPAPQMATLSLNGSNGVSHA